MHTLFDDTTPALQLEDFRCRLRQVCGDFGIEPKPARVHAEQGRIHVHKIGQFDMAVVSCDVQYVERKALDIKRDPAEHLFWLVQDVGESVVDQNGQQTHLKPGSMFIADAAYPSRFSYFAQPSRQLSIHLPRTEMLHRYGAICTGGLALDSSDPMCSALHTVLAKIITNGGSYPLEEALLSLLGAYLHSLHNTQKTCASHTLLSRAMILIDRHAANPDFGPKELAQNLNVSERMLQRHFHTIGETPRHRLLDKRLQLAYARLQEHACRPQEKISNIALDCGFNDLSYFYREFRKKYHQAPGQLLNPTP